MSLALTPTERRERLQRLTVLSAASAFASGAAHAAGSCQAWSSATAYSAGDTVSEAGNPYKANWWTQGNDPATSNGATGTG
jgi:chitinase